MRNANKARGEVPLKVGGVDLILCATMENLDALEQATGGLALLELMERIGSCHGSTLKAGLKSLAVEGDADKAWQGQIGAAQWPVIQLALQQVLVPDLEGNAEAGAGNP